MGQRSQIYVRIGLADGRKHLFPRYYQWNYAERMLSRARGIIEWLESYSDYPDFIVTDEQTKEKMVRIMDTNFDYRDVVLSHDIIKEYKEQQEWLKAHEQEQSTFEQIAFAGQDNNDGQLFIDLQVDFNHRDKKGGYKYVIKYAFRDTYENEWQPMDPEEYMDWDYEDWRTSEYMKDCVKLTERNIAWIRKHAKLMTEDEVFEFAHHDYVKDMQL